MIIGQYNYMIIFYNLTALQYNNYEVIDYTFYKIHLKMVSGYIKLSCREVTYFPQE